MTTGPRSPVTTAPARTRECAPIVTSPVTTAVGATQVMRTLLFDTSATDPWTFAVMAVGALVIALCACLIPAMRAMRVDPLVALRAE